MLSVLYSRIVATLDVAFRRWIAAVIDGIVAWIFAWVLQWIVHVHGLAFHALIAYAFCIGLDQNLLRLGQTVGKRLTQLRLSFEARSRPRLVVRSVLKWTPIFVFGVLAATSPRDRLSTAVWLTPAFEIAWYGSLVTSPVGQTVYDRVVRSRVTTKST